MAPNKKCLALPSVVQLCAIPLVLCKALSAAPAKDQDKKFLDLWPENSCTFPTKLVMTQVQTLCDKSKLDDVYVINTTTWQFVNTACHTILNISSNICRVPKETLEKHNITQDKLINYMNHDTVNVCVEVAGTAVTKIWAGLEFVVDDNSTCQFVFDDRDASKLLRLLYRLAWARHTLPPSPDVVWKNGFTTFRKSWDSLNCTFPPRWAMETDVNHTCYNPPRNKPESEPWKYQEKLCAALFKVTMSVCTDPVSGHGLKGLLDNEQFKVCDEADKLKKVMPDLASELSRVFTDSPNMCTHLCVDDKHVTRMCKLLFFAMTVPRLQHLQRLMQPMLGGGSADSATHTTPADGGPSGTQTQPADGGPSGTQTQPADGGPSDTQTQPADGGSSDTQTQPADGGPSDTQTQPADSGPSDTQTQPDDGGPSDTQTQPTDGGPSGTQTQPADGGRSDTQTQPADVGPSDTQTQPADGGPSDTQTQPADGGPSDTQTQPADGGPSDAQTQPADGGHSDTHAAPADGGNSDDTPPKDEDPNANPVAKTMAESLQSGSSVLLMVYIVTAICSVLLLYVLFHNRRRIIDCVLGRRESWQRHRDAERDGKYSPLDAAVEDFLSLDKAVTKSKTHVY